MESKDVIKELQCVSEWFTEHGKNTNTAVIEISKKAIELINQQQAEIEKLKNSCSCLAIERDAYKDVMSEAITEAKIEAYKEFADMLKERASKGFWDELAYVDTNEINDLLTELTERKECKTD